VSELEGVKSFTVTVHGVNMDGAASWTLLDQSKPKQSFDATYSRGTVGNTMPLYVFDAAGLVIGQYTIAYREYTQEIVFLATEFDPAASITVGVSELEGVKSFTVTVHGVNMDGAASWTLLDQSKPKQSFDATYSRGTLEETMPLFIFDAAGLVIGQFTIAYREYTKEIVFLNIGELYDVTFTVTDGVDPLEGALVEISGVPAETTGSDGKVSFALRNADYSYTITKSGHQTATGTVTVADEDKDLAVTLPAIYTVTFTVTCGDDAIVGASINIADTTLTTDAEGKAEITLVNDTYEYTVTALGYNTVTNSVTINNAIVEEVVALTMTEYTVIFTVTDGVNPVAQAVIDIQGEAKETDATGTATFNLTNDSYDYTVSKAGYVEDSGSFTVTNADKTISVTLIDEDTVPHQVEFTITYGGTPITGASVQIDGDTLTTDSNGKAVISLVNENYPYTVTALGYNGESGFVEVSNAAKQINISLTQAEYAVTFVIKDEDSQLLAGAEVVVTGKLAQTTGADGTVVFNLTNGSYQYTVSKEGYLDFSRTFTVSNEARTFNVTLVDKNSVPHAVTFTVTDGVNPISGAVIDILGEEKVTDGNGTAVFDLVNGPYPYTVTATGHKPESGEITVANDVVAEDVALTPIYAVTFTVSETDESPLLGAIVTIGLESKTTNEQGTAVFVLEDGNYNYTVSKHGYDTETGSFTVSGSSVDIAVSLNETKYTATFTVVEGSLPISGANVVIGATTKTTNEDGIAEFELINGTYSYTVTAFGFNTKTGSVTVSYAGITEDVAMKRPSAVVSVTTDVVLSVTTYHVTVHSTDLEGAYNWTIREATEQKKWLGESYSRATELDSMTLFIFNSAGDVIATYQISSRTYTNEDVVLTVTF
jgi:uncharacterized membrane protein